MPKVRSQHVFIRRFRAAPPRDRTLRKEISMFETSVVQARAKAPARRPVLFSVSIGAHAAVVIGVVAMSVATVSLPKNAPRQVTFPVFSEIKPLLGDLGAQKKASDARPQQAVKRQTTAPAVVAPNVVPSTVTPVTQSTADLGPIGPATVPSTGGDTSGPGVPWGRKDGLGDGPPVISTAPPAQIFKVGGDVKAPVVLRRVTPLYP